MQKNKRIIGASVLLVILFFAAYFLLGSDFRPFIKWYIALFILGIGFFPLTEKLFHGYASGGWIFSKVLGLAVSGYIVWVLVTAGALKFTNRRVLVVTLIVLGAVSVVFVRMRKEKEFRLEQILTEEVLFLGLLILWTYIIGFKPDAYGTEKYMDYGLMAVMKRSVTLPSADMWFSTDPVNYYYGGQYYAVYLTKLTYSSVKYTYSLMRATIAALTFVLPYSLVDAMLRRHFRHNEKMRRCAPYGGVLAGLSVSVAGNLHYVWYGLIGKLFPQSKESAYWFADSTRYIGYRPDVADKCIHEFPAYSTVLGDLHAHYINLIFVLLLIGLLYAGTIRQSDRKESEIRDASMKTRVFALFWNPQLIAVSWLLGVFKWTNYWDFVIYFVIVIVAIIVLALRTRGRSKKYAVLYPIAHAVLTLIISAVVALPFTLQFQSPVASVALAKNHSLWYQLLLLWGLPILVVILLGIIVGYRAHRDYQEEFGNHFLAFFRKGDYPDLCALMIGCCAIGLVILPELVYVVDIYGSGYARANTMFKLTYQAFVIFAIVTGYTLPRVIVGFKEKRVRIPAIILLVLQVLTMGYTVNAVHSWFGNIFDRSQRKGIDASVFLEEVYPEDASVIRWMQANIRGVHTTLEAPGDSYTDANRVSALTGMPTVEGWYTHEWLWRNDTAEQNRRVADIEAIYTAELADDANRLLDRYEVEYVFVGSCEREKYGEDLSETMLRSLGEVVYEYQGSFLVKRQA